MFPKNNFFSGVVANYQRVHDSIEFIIFMADKNKLRIFCVTMIMHE